MPRPMRRATFAAPNQCPACWITFQPETVVIRTDSTTLCETHAWFIVEEAIVWRGRWEHRGLTPS